MCWTDHVVRMGDGRLPKQRFHEELTKRKRPENKPRKWFKGILLSLRIRNDVKNVEAFSENRATWRNLIRERCSNFERKRV